MRAVGPALRVIFALSLPLSTSAVGFAEDSRPEASIDHDRDARRRAFYAAYESALLRSEGGKQDITYADVLEDPDNVALNFQYARKQVAQSNLRGASSTLERILLLAPDLPRIRLFYAVVLYRLGNIDEAESAFLEVAKYRLAPDTQVELDGYLDQITRTRRHTRYSASLSIASQMDTNKNAAPLSESILFQDQVVPLASSSLAESDQAVVAIADLRIERDLRNQEGNLWITGFTYYDAAQRDLEDFELQALSVESKLELNTDWARFTPRVFGSTVLLAHETYIEAGGLGLRIDRAVSPKVAWFQNLELEYQDFKPVDSSPTAAERSGRTVRLDTGIDFTPHARHRIGFQLGTSHKLAREDYHELYGSAAALSHLWILPGGAFALSSFTATYDRYSKPQEFVAHRKRRDTKLRSQVVLGAPVDLLLSPFTSRSLAPQTSFNVRVEYLKSASNLRNYAYRNTTVAFSLSSSLQF